MPKLKPAHDEDEDLLEDIDDLDEDYEDEDEPTPTSHQKVRVATNEDEDDIDDEDEEDDEETVAPVARRPMPVAKPAKPVVVSPPPEDEDITDDEFDREAKKRKQQQMVDGFLERKRSEETVSVDEITELMLDGDSDKILRELVQYCADNSGIKKAKQLLREARDRAKARVTRIAGVVSVMLDELKEEDESRAD